MKEIKIEDSKFYIKELTESDWLRFVELPKNLRILDFLEFVITGWENVTDENGDHLEFKKESIQNLPIYVIKIILKEIIPDYLKKMNEDSANIQEFLKKLG